MNSSNTSELWSEMIETGHEEDWNWKNVGRFLYCVGVTDRLNCTERDWDEDNDSDNDLPESTYAIAVTDPQLLSHLTPGMEWDSTAYDHDEKPKFDLAWRTSDVQALAKGINASQDFSGMQVLADALQEAGCDSNELLNHLRDTNATHVRGCWALDLVLGKE